MASTEPAAGEGRPRAHISMATKHTPLPPEASQGKKGTLMNHRNAHTSHPEAYLLLGENTKATIQRREKKTHTQRPRVVTNRPEVWNNSAGYHLIVKVTLVKTVEPRMDLRQNSSAERTRHCLYAMITTPKIVETFRTNLYKFGQNTEGKTCPC